MSHLYVGAFDKDDVCRVMMRRRSRFAMDTGARDAEHVSLEFFRFLENKSIHGTGGIVQVSASRRELLK